MSHRTALRLAHDSFLSIATTIPVGAGQGFVGAALGAVRVVSAGFGAAAVSLRMRTVIA